MFSPGTNAMSVYRQSGKKANVPFKGETSLVYETEEIKAAWKFFVKMLSSKKPFRQN